MNDKTCNRCHKKGLGWDLEFHKKMGKWKLENHRVNGKWCNKPRENLTAKKSDYDLCELCSESSFGNVRSEDKEEHLRKYHPNGEMLTDLDFIAEFQTQYTTDRFWKHDPHYDKYKNNK